MKLDYQCFGLLTEAFLKEMSTIYTQETHGKTGNIYSNLTLTECSDGMTNDEHSVAVRLLYCTLGQLVMLMLCFW